MDTGKSGKFDKLRNLPIRTQNPHNESCGGTGTSPFFSWTRSRSKAAAPAPPDDTQNCEI